MFESGINETRKIVVITQRQDGKYTDFDPEQFKYQNMIFNADCVIQSERDWKGNIVRKKGLPHENLQDCTFRIVSWPLISGSIPKEKKVAMARTTQGIRQTEETIDYRWKTYQEFLKNKVQIAGKVYVDIINGFDKPMRFKIFREKDDLLIFPRALIHAGTNEIEALGDSIWFNYDKCGHNIYKNTLYRFVIMLN